MKRRKNAIYTGKSKRTSTGTGNRLFVDAFYRTLNTRLLPEDEVEIIPLKQINPTHDTQHQILIVTNYCVRKILPEVTGLFVCGDEVTPRLRALAPIVDKETADAAYAAAADALDAYRDAAFAVGRNAAAAYAPHEAAAEAAFAAREAARSAAYATYDKDSAVEAADWAARGNADVVYSALVVCITIGDEATYNRIIDLTNEMLESL